MAESRRKNQLHQQQLDEQMKKRVQDYKNKINDTTKDALTQRKDSLPEKLSYKNNSVSPIKKKLTPSKQLPRTPKPEPSTLMPRQVYHLKPPSSSSTTNTLATRESSKCSRPNFNQRMEKHQKQFFFLL